VRLNEEKLRLGQYLFERHGGKVIFFGRFLPVLRIWAAFLAGANRMRWRRFLAFNAAGGSVWATVMGLGAYALGDGASQLGSSVGLGMVALAMSAMVGIAIALRRSERRWRAEANRALASRARC
jgi:membrane protein DedA with SNARE-associated domain